MSKIIRIDKCTECQHYRIRCEDNVKYCDKMQVKLDFRLETQIPDWCPLEEENKPYKIQDTNI